MLYIFAVSDSVGETANQVAKAAASQFKDKAVVKRVPYVQTIEDVDLLIDDIKKYDKALVVSTIITMNIRQYLLEKTIQNNILAINILAQVVDVASSLLKCIPSYNPGAVRQIDEEYFRKIESIEFAIQYDDGKDYRGLKNADVILIGMSRTSKTPVCMCLANKGIKAINVPLVPEVEVPQELFEIDKRRIFCLTIDPFELMDIRNKRIEKYKNIAPSINYAKEERIIEEFDFFDRVTKKLKCRIIDVTKRAVEDTACIIENYIKK